MAEASYLREQVVSYLSQTLGDAAFNDWGSGDKIVHMKDPGVASAFAQSSEEVTLERDACGNATSKVHVLTMAKYVEAHSMDGTWASDVEIQAVASVLKTIIHVVVRIASQKYMNAVQSFSAGMGALTDYIYVEWDGVHYSPWCMSAGTGAGVALSVGLVWLFLVWLLQMVCLMTRQLV